MYKIYRDLRRRAAELYAGFSQMTNSRIPFPENSPGAFYVEDGCCTSCGMPSTVAPSLFSYANDGHCYVSKQPSDGKEIFQMIEAFAVQDIGCIRYKGSNRVIQIKLIAVGEGDQCDQLDPDLQALNQEVKNDRCGLA
jgi:ferredoxin